MPRFALFLLVGAFVLCSAKPARSQGYPAVEAAAKMTVPDDLELNLVAAEPMVRQPVCIEVDDRGRLWVIQYLQYPNPAGLQRAKVDRFSRTIYDRVPEPPPTGPRGADRITILEDTDGDGMADSSHDFIDGLNLSTGLAFGYGGVFVLQVPYLLFYPDRDQDDVPDGDPEVLVSGFGMDDAHSVANSLTWGSDGWLYGCQGSTVTARIEGIEFQQGVWRYHPLQRKFELFVEGGGNSWGLDFDKHGRLLYGTNHGGFRMLHAVPGGYYWKSFGKHGPLHNPHAYGFFDHVPHTGYRGGHVTVGGIIYQGDSFPAKYRDKYFFADTLGHQVLWDHIEPRQSTVKTSNGGDLAVSNDTWSAPCDVTTGPDGAIYFCDFYDERTGHPDPDAEWDRRNGRIYRLRARSAGDAGRRDVTPKWPQLTTPQLIALHEHANNWIVRRARRILTERRDSEAVLPLQTIALTSSNDQVALESFGTYASMGGLTDATAPQFLNHRNPHIRRSAVQFLGDQRGLQKATVQRLCEMARTEPEVEVRTLLACTARRLPSHQALPILQALLMRDEDAGDPYQPLLLWWGIEQHSLSARNEIVAWLSSIQSQQKTLCGQTILPRLVRRYAAEGTLIGLQSCGDLISSVPDESQPPLLAAMEQGLAERAEPASRPFAELPDRLKMVLNSAWTKRSADPTTLRLGLRFGIPGVGERVQELALTGASVDQRKTAMQTLAELGGHESIAPLLSILVNEKEPGVLRLAAIDGLQRFRDDRTRDALLKLYSNPSTALQPRISQALLARPEWAAEFLQKFLSKEFPVKNLKAEDWQTVIEGMSEEDRELIIKTWGSVSPPTAEERLAEVRRLNNDLRAAAGDPARGKQLFGQHCATCHQLHGEGFKVGPDLTHVNRKDRDYLLVQLVDPNAIIRKEYLAYVAATTDGRVATGLLVEQNAAELTLMAAKEEKTTIAIADLDELKESKASLMPENVLKPLRPQDLRDLFSYLQQSP